MQQSPKTVEQMTAEVIAVENIRSTLKALQVKVEKTKAENAELNALLDADPMFKDAEEKYHNARNADREAKVALSSARMKARAKVTTDSWCVSYAKKYSGQVETTIRPEIIESIKTHLQIGKLKSSQVEDIARQLIEMVLKAEHPELIAQAKTADDAEKAASSHLEHVRSMFFIVRYPGLRSTYDDEKEIERLQDVLADPAKTKREVERMAIPSKIDAIYETMRTKVV